MGLDDTTPWGLACYEILAAMTVAAAIGYVIWYFVDYWENGPG